MLARHLKQLRHSKAVHTSQALQKLGSDWSEVEGGVTREFVFEDFTQASHFMQRYAAYC